jgi:predicted P-loop ATPase
VAHDFKGLAAACLAQAELLLPQYFGGRKVGRQWIGESTSKGGPGDSWSISLDTGKWQHFATGRAGGDIISAVAALRQIENGAAYDLLSRDVGAFPPLGRELPRIAPKPARAPPERIPDDATPPTPHWTYGEPSHRAEYGNDFWVLRYDIVQGNDIAKRFLQYTWRAGKWSATAYPAPRPLYHRRELQANPSRPVIIVEGERCADEFTKLIADPNQPPILDAIVITWAGGAIAVKQSDWTPLTGRRVTIWPDADDPGRKAATDIIHALTPICNHICVVNPEPDRPRGWDVADAIADGWDAARIAVYIDQRAVPINAPQTPATTVSALGEPDDAHEYEPHDDTSEPNEYDINEPVRVINGHASLTDWDSLGLAKSHQGLPFPTLANASSIILRHPHVNGKIWLDTFQHKVWHTMKGTKREWSDQDTRELTIFVQQSMRLSKFNSGLMHEAVLHAATVNAKNSLHDYLNALVWDGQPRLENWLTDITSAENTHYLQCLGRNWLISMVARAFQPGCQVDHMPVLEGTMGRGKTSLLAMLGGEWYETVNTAIGDRAFLEAIQGCWLVEIPDMAGFRQRDYSVILSTITTRRDRFRESYGRLAQDHPRGCVFAATSETDDYLISLLGKRRFWPIRCTHIDLDALAQQRDHLFAEAVHHYRKGYTWHEMPDDETQAEQAARHEPDLWREATLRFAENLIEENKRHGTHRLLTSADILQFGLEMPLYKQTQKEKNRIATILRDAHFIQQTIRGQRAWFPRADRIAPHNADR